MPITTTTTATCDYSACGIELDPDALPVKVTLELRFPNGATQRREGCSCTPGHMALAAEEWRVQAQAELDAAPQLEVETPAPTS